MKTILTVILLILTTVARADVSFGNPHGSMVLVEYFDYNCPVCRYYAPIINRLVKNNSDLKVIQRVVPVLAPSSVFVDSVVLASYMQNKFPEIQAAILQVKDTETIPIQEVISIAKKLGLNLAKLKHDMNSDAIRKQLINNLKNYHALKQTAVPIIIIYKTNFKKAKKLFIGAYPIQILQNSIDKLRLDYQVRGEK